MRRLLLTVCVLMLFGLVACDKADRTLNPVERAKGLKKDIEKKAADMEDAVRARADQAMEGLRKEAGIETPADQKNAKPYRHEKKNVNEDDEKR